jgi:protein gp37
VTKIKWTEKTWNPVTGCTKVSAGCKNCYAERMSKRLQAMGQPNYVNGFDTVTCHEHMLEHPMKRKKPTMYFVCSMSDLFHKDVGFAFTRLVFDVMYNTPHHTYQVLTKRPDRMAAFSRTICWPKNVWAGTSAENQKALNHRLPFLLDIPAPIRFLSCEPLIGRIEPHFFPSEIQWVIVGGESGPGARPMIIEWAFRLRKYCYARGIPFFFKQRGGTRRGDNWELLGSEKVQEWPKLWEEKAKRGK